MGSASSRGTHTTDRSFPAGGRNPTFCQGERGRHGAGLPPGPAASAQGGGRWMAFFTRSLLPLQRVRLGGPPSALVHTKARTPLRSLGALSPRPLCSQRPGRGPQDLWAGQTLARLRADHTVGPPGLHLPSSGLGPVLTRELCLQTLPRKRPQHSPGWGAGWAWRTAPP